MHRDKVRNTTLAFKSPKLGFTLGLWKDGWIRVQRVAQTCPHFLALAPGDALLRVGVDKVPVPFPRDDFAGLLRKLSAAPRPLELTFVRVLDDAPAPPATSPEFALVEDPPTPAAAAGGRRPSSSPPAPAPAAAPSARHTAAAAAITTEAGAGAGAARARGGALDLPDVRIAVDGPKKTPEVAARETRHELDKKADGGEPDAAAGLAVGPARRARGPDAAGLALAF